MSSQFGSSTPTGSPWPSAPSSAPPADPWSGAPWQPGPWSGAPWQAGPWQAGPWGGAPWQMPGGGVTPAWGAPPWMSANLVPSGSGRATKLLRSIGTALMVLGALAAILLIGEGSARSEEAVAKLVRIGAGCTETINVTSAGTYNVYSESGYRSSLDGEGDRRCAPSADAGSGRLAFTILDQAGQEVDLAPGSGDEYHADGLSGSVSARFTVTAPTTFTVRVEPGWYSQRVAIGLRDNSPHSITVRMTVVGLAVGGGVLLLGLALLLWGRSRRLNESSGATWGAAPAALPPAGASGAWGQTPWAQLPWDQMTWVATPWGYVAMPTPPPGAPGAPMPGQAVGQSMGATPPTAAVAFAPPNYPSQQPR